MRCHLSPVTFTGSKITEAAVAKIQTHKGKLSTFHQWLTTMKRDHEILALAAFWQSQLEVIVITAELYAGNSNQTLKFPCSLITLAPFAPGGVRRLVINIQAPLIVEAAHYLRTKRDEEAIRVLGESIVRSASWPLSVCDNTVEFGIQWNMERGLIATPHHLCILPVPHQLKTQILPPTRYSTSSFGSSPSVHVPLVVWPRRVYKLDYPVRRDCPNATKAPHYRFVAECWHLRDDALELEWECLINKTKKSNRKRLSLPPSNNNNHPHSLTALLTWAPCLPVFCVADYLALHQLVPKHSVLSEASQFLIENDHLFALSLWFGVPLLDRTGTLSSACKSVIFVRPVPTRHQVQAFRQQQQHSSLLLSGHDLLFQLLEARATQLWNETERVGSTTSVTTTTNGRLYVAWSGGIDSTAVLCAVLATAHLVKDRLQRITVILDDESLAEHPSFFETYIRGRLTIRQRQDRPLSWHEQYIRREHVANVFVTGELGDQLFGSDRMGAAFPHAYGTLLEPLRSPNMPTPLPAEFRGIFAERGLASRWQETVIPSMRSVGLISDPTTFETWIQPQLSQAPLPIVSTFDFLWWLNFSMKWQGVYFRCLHDGGDPPLLGRATNMNDILGCIRHFFDDPSFECWSCIEDFHCLKMPCLTDWKTYKEPLKSYIKRFTGDDEYYREKIKVGSLSFGAPDEPSAWVHRFYGASVDLVPQSEQSIAFRTGNLDWVDTASNPQLLSWGVCGLRAPKIGTLVPLLHPRLLDTLRHYPYKSTQRIHLNPWNDSASWPFDMAPYFAEDDDRQRRVFNPVTKITLTGKCAALLTRDILLDRSFLDLGACLGASSHYALCLGARYATVVEIQEDFCIRAETLLQRACESACWSSTNNEVGSRFEVVRSGVREYLATCPDSSHDVILAAGILHCFVDPVEILLEMSRVASHAVLIEMIHASAYMDGYLDDEDDWRLGREEATVDGLKFAARALPRRLANNGILQIDSGSLVNMAGNDASFKGLAVLPSRAAIESLMSSSGFDVHRVFLEEHPTMNKDVLTYTGTRKYRALSKRYFLRCVRKQTNQPTLKSLESRVSKDDRLSSAKWESPWAGLDPLVTNKQVVGDNPSTDQTRVLTDDEAEWEFDEKIAKRFEREAFCHIPDYEAVIDDSIALLERHLRQRSISKDDVKIVDVGCATGHTLVKLHNCGFTKVHGVDVAAPMLERARENLLELGFDTTGETLHLSPDAIELPKTIAKDVGAAFVNWTLHFVPNSQDRIKLLRNIALCMEAHGLLVLTEKTEQHDLAKEAYYDFKRSRGVSDKEITIKEKRLKGVLEPFSIPWYFEALKECGFVDVCLFRARYGFATFVARRREDPASCINITTLVSIVEKPFLHWENLSEAAHLITYQTDPDDPAPFSVVAWGRGTGLGWEGGSRTGTTYGIIHEGPVDLIVSESMSFRLLSNMYFCSSGPIKLKGGSGILHMVENHRALFAVGGPVEKGPGRLPYIDGCTDSLLLAPTLKGSPCLNHLHFPPHTKQTQHIHPSGRSGIVIRGRGTCVYGDFRTPLVPGTVFVIPTNATHAFETDRGDTLDVVAFHPDSDFGPSSNDHPMINRTMIGGVSASTLKSIQTKADQKGR